MTAEILLHWLLDGAIATSAALLLVLALRRPLRRMFGARIAYMTWALVPLTLAAVSLPAPRSITALQQVLPLLRPTVIVGAAVPLANAANPVTPSTIDWLLLLALGWCLGAISLALHFRRQQRRFVAGLGQLRPRGDGTFAAGAEQCPAVVGAWRPRIVLPADFETRYPGQQAALVLAHERAHVRRGDVRANLAIAALRCLHWFNPLLHLAAERFRLDQELACDAAVLARNPQARRAYADAMLNTQLAVPGLPVGCHWQSSQSLKERILMLKRPQPGAWRRRFGAIALCAVLTGSSYAAWALRPASDAAPAYRGYVESDAVAIAKVQIPAGMNVDVSGGSMTTLRSAAGGTVNVMLDPGSELRARSRDAGDPWLVRIKAAGTASNPTVTWALERNGRTELERVLPVPASTSTAIDLSALSDAQGRAPSIAFSRLPADHVIDIDEYGGAGGDPLSRDTDDAYRQADPIHTLSSNYKADGHAVLLVGVGSDGRVQTIDIERMTPAGALTGAEVDQLVQHNVYKPQVINGKPVPTQIRIPVQFSRQASPPIAVPDSPSAAVKDHLPAPKYPAAAAANKVTGKVMLIIDVAADGSVADARVEKSQPAGVFDQVTLDAVKHWRFEPAIKDGKPVAGRIRVPVTFEMDRPKDGEADTKGGNA